MAESKTAGRPKGPKRPPATSLRLDSELKQLAWMSARTLGLNLTEWMNGAIRAQLRLEGRKVERIARDKWRQLGLPAKDGDDET